MAQRVTIFGGGAIGRGLLADIASRAGYQVVFVEAVENVADKIRQAGGYKVHLVGQAREEHSITDYQVLMLSQEPQIRNAVCHSSFAAIAVGGIHLPSVVPILAPAIKSRKENLNILVCENWPHADLLLRNLLIQGGCDRDTFSCIPCSVERMAKVADNGLDILAESNQSLYIDSQAWIGERPPGDEFLFCDNITAYYKRKLFTNNAGHALLAYFGPLTGYEYLYQGLEFTSVRNCLVELLELASRALVQVYSLDQTAMEQHLADLLQWRYSNRLLADTVKRAARDPLRKLGPDERLVGLVRLLQNCNLPTRPVYQVIAAAMHYDDRGDSECVQMRRMIQQNGPESVLEGVCGFEKGEEHYQQCLEIYQQIVIPK